jgi:hypothetical protein
MLIRFSGFVKRKAPFAAKLPEQTMYIENHRRPE